MRRCPAQSPGCLRGVQSPCGLARPNRSRGSKCCKLAQPGLSLRSSAWIFEPRPGCRLVTATAESGTGSGEGSDFDVEAMLQVAAALSDDPERPSYHIMSQKGWLNDPNGPIFHDGLYHLFYQHIVNGCEWDFGIVWGHAVSTNLVHWQHLPPAIVPSPGGADADGCFSGCCVVDTDGTPVILYTGVRLRSNPDCGPLPSADRDLNLPFLESQLSAKPLPGDKNLVTWQKAEMPLIGLPPSSLPLVGWRDPFIFEVSDSSSGGRWGMLMGSGLKGKGGSVMIYRADSLLGEWQYDGMLCGAETTDTGAMWECPLLLELQRLPEEARPCGLGPRGHTNLRARAESYRTMSQAEHPDDGDSSDSSDDDLAEGIFVEDSAAGSKTAAKAEQLQELQFLLQEDTDLLLQKDSGDSLSNEASYQHLKSVDPAAAAGHPADSEPGQNIPDITDPGLASTADGAGEQLQALQLDPGHAAASGDSAPHLSAAPEAAQPPVPGQPSAISLDLGKAREMALAKFDVADPSILNAGLPEDYKRSPTQSKITEPQRPSQAPAAISHLSEHRDGQALNPEPPPRFTHFLCVSPDAPTNPVVYWLGLFDTAQTEFLINKSKGPYRLDLGDVMYAPNIQTDKLGRHVLWGWLQERRKAGSYDYSGCMTVPRLLYLEDERLIQVPIPEISRLRTGEQWSAQELKVPCEGEVPLPGKLSPAMDFHIVLSRGTSESAGLLFRSWNVSEGNAAILFDFDRSILEAVFELSGTDLASSAEIWADDETLRRVGGPTELEYNCDVHLRVLIDHSCIEVFTGSGEVLSTRVYRGAMPADGDPGISFISFGGDAVVVQVEAHEMGTIWREDINKEAPAPSAAGKGHRQRPPAPPLAPIPAGEAALSG